MTPLVPNHCHTALLVMRHFWLRAIDHASVWGVACIPHSLATELAKDWLLMRVCSFLHSLKCLLDDVHHFEGTEDERIGIGGCDVPGILTFQQGRRHIPTEIQSQPKWASGPNGQSELRTILLRIITFWYHTAISKSYKITTLQIINIKLIKSYDPMTFWYHKN